MTEYASASYGIHWTYDDMDYRYRVGRVSQDEWEAFNAIHPVNAGAYPVEDNAVARLVVATADAFETYHGRPINTPNAAVRNIADARAMLT